MKSGYEYHSGIATALFACYNKEMYGKRNVNKHAFRLCFRTRAHE